MGDRVRIGLLGVGRIADLQDLGDREHPDAELFAVCDLDAERARARTEAWGAPRFHTDLERFLADPEIDAVDVCTPHHLHAEHAVAADRVARGWRCARAIRPPRHPSPGTQSGHSSTWSAKLRCSSSAQASRHGLAVAALRRPDSGRGSCADPSQSAYVLFRDTVLTCENASHAPATAWPS